MPDPTSEPFLDLGSRPHVVKGRGFSFQLSLAERVRIARGVRQAVVKVTSFSHGTRGVRDHLDYISREGELALEKDTGEILEGRDMQKELVSDWSIDFDANKNSRDTANIVFSMPPGSNDKVLRQAVRATGARAFPNHEWVFAVHEDRKHPHAHMVVKMRGKEKGKKLRLKKAELYTLRETFAEASREQGVELAASPRAARGVGRKATRRFIRQLRDKKIVPNVLKKAYQEAMLERALPEKPWEKAMAERNKLEREAYRKCAAELRLAAEKQTQQQAREQMLKDAQALERYAQIMPKAKTKRQLWLEQEKQKREEQQREKARQQDRGMGMER